MELITKQLSGFTSNEQLEHGLKVDISWLFNSFFPQHFGDL